MRVISTEAVKLLRQELPREEFKKVLKVLNIEDPFYSIGEMFKDAAGEQYILAQVDSNKCALISLVTGNRYNDPVRVKSAHNITEEEFEWISGSCYNKFTRL